MAQVRLVPGEIRAVQQVLRSGQLRAGQLSEGGEEIARVQHVWGNLAGGRDAGPVGDQRDQAAAFEHRAFLTGEAPPADG